MYRCRATNEAGTAYSDTVLLTVTRLAKPTFKNEYLLEDRTVSAGLRVQLTVTAEGKELSYQWQVSKDGGKTWKNCTSTGYDTDTLCFTAALKYSGWMYRCVVSNPCWDAISRELVLTVQEPDGYSANTAFPIKNGETYNLVWAREDIDKSFCLQFTMPSRGVFAFSMTKPLYKGEPVEFELTISKMYDRSSMHGWVAETSALKDQEDEEYAYCVGLDAGVYIIDLRVKQTNVPDTMEALFGYAFTASDNWEIENNDFDDDATDIVVGETYYGILGETARSPSCDWYRIKLKKDKRYLLILDNIEELNKICSEPISFMGGSQASIVTGEGQVETAFVAILEPDETAYYLIPINGPMNKPGVPYALTVTLYEE